MTHRTSLLKILLFASLVTSSAAQDAGPSARTFLIDLGQPGLKIDISGHQGLTDSRGTLRVTITVAEGDTLHFRSLDPSWGLDLSRQVPAEDPTIPILWDLTAELRPADPGPPESAPPEPKPVAARPDPCRDPSSLFCRQAHWMRFEKAMARGDCTASLGALDELESKFPDLFSSEDGALTFAKAHLDCGIQDRDPDLIRRALEKALSQNDGILWCRPTASRLLARAFEALGEGGAAAASARTAKPRCQPEETAALEWELYFRLRLGEEEAAVALAEQAPRPLSLFFKAWLDSNRGVCESRVELEATGDLPCRGLPQEFCSRQYGRLLLACGRTSEQFTTAARYLRAALPADPGTWNRLPGGRELALELAEAEILTGDPQSAIQIYERLMLTEDSMLAEDGMPTDDATLLRLYADALMLSSGEEAVRRQALAAYTQARDALDPSSLDYAVVLNNLCVLRVRIDETMASREIALDLETLETAVGQISEQEPRLHLRLRHNALSLHIRQLERATDLGAQQQFARLQELRTPFADYQRELVSLHEDAPSRVLAGAENLLEIFDQQGRRFAVAVP